MVELVTLLAGLHHSRFKSLSVVPLLQITDSFCTSAAILHCLKVTANFGGKSLRVLIFKRLFPIETKRKASCILVKEDYLQRTGRNTQDFAWQGSGELHLQSCSQHQVYHVVPGVPSSPDLTVSPWVVYFVASVCRNHTTHWVSWHIVKALLMSK